MVGNGAILLKLSASLIPITFQIAFTHMQTTITPDLDEVASDSLTTIVPVSDADVEKR